MESLQSTTFAMSSKPNFVLELQQKGTLVNVEFTCEICHKKQHTKVFRKRNRTLGRICSHNIEYNVSSDCQYDEKCESLQFDTMYSDWDILFEYTQKFEFTKLIFLPDWWRRNNYHSMLECNKLLKIHRQMSHYTEFMQQIINKKEKWLTEQGVQNVNEHMLEAPMRFLDFYKTCITYWAMLHKSSILQKDIRKEYLKCHGCKQNYYIHTQYHSYYVVGLARELMHHLQWVAGDQYFVCASCINRCMDDARALYNKLKQTSVLYKACWKDCSYLQKVLFALGHLDTSDKPIYISWFNMSDGEWIIGKVLSVNNVQFTLTGQNIINVSQRSHKFTISIKNMSHNEYFIYQQQKCPFEKLDAELAAVDINPDYYDQFFTKKQLMSPNGLSLATNSRIPMIYNGKNIIAKFTQVQHMKCVYDFLSYHNFI